jgi:hypothetical protein
VDCDAVEEALEGGSHGGPTPLQTAYACLTIFRSSLRWVRRGASIALRSC